VCIKRNIFAIQLGSSDPLISPKLPDYGVKPYKTVLCTGGLNPEVQQLSSCGYSTLKYTQIDDGRRMART
jgi:hypothetical protein